MTNKLYHNSDNVGLRVDLYHRAVGAAIWYIYILSCCGSDRDTVFPSKTVVFQFYNLVLTP